MNISDMIIGTKLEIAVFDYSGTEMKPVYISQLEEILSDGSIVIAAPIQEGKIIPISTGSKIKVSFFHPSGLFAFKGEITARAKRESIFVLKVSIIGNINKIQRREYFRFDCLMPGKLKIVKSAETGKLIKNSPLENIMIKDISGGGVGLLTDERYQINDIIELELSLDGQAVRTLGKIVRCNIFEQDGTKYDTGICFQGIGMRDRDTIVKFIFQRQSKLRQKGLV